MGKKVHVNLNRFKQNLQGIMVNNVGINMHFLLEILNTDKHITVRIEFLSRVSSIKVRPLRSGIR